MKAKPPGLVGWTVPALFLASTLGFAYQGSSATGVQQGALRQPVLLVPGWMGRSQDMMPLKERLVRDGWDADWVIPLEFEDPVGSSADHAEELDEAIAAVLRTTGAPRVDIIAHSMGGLAVWNLLQEKGSQLPIGRVVFLATPFQGTVTAYLAWGDGGPEMIPGSEFLQELQQGGWPQRWVQALAIRTPLDLTVVPGEGATLLGRGDRMVCCPTHQGLLDHEETYAMIREFLLDGDGSPETPDSIQGGQRAEVAKSIR